MKKKILKPKSPIQLSDDREIDNNLKLSNPESYQASKNLFSSDWKIRPRNGKGNRKGLIINKKFSCAIICIFFSLYTHTMGVVFPIVLVSSSSSIGDKDQW